MRFTRRNCPRVYPRVCGGTVPHLSRVLREDGLSPRVRGNPDCALPAGTAPGSIPACAGEPREWRRTKWIAEVYPRVCGGTLPPQFCPRNGQGLSPRVRGNLSTCRHAIAGCRSIPACAGEPPGPPGDSSNVRVYPRVCGGTRKMPLKVLNLRGLSPRVRGNPPEQLKPARRQRSIPACAGEPCPPPRRNWGQRVYPRVCGGTMLSTPPALDEEGLSPRVRGNLSHRLPLRF